MSIVSALRSVFGEDDIAAPLRELQRAAADEGIPIKVTSTRRTQREQDELYAQGRTRPGPIVTWTRDSAHVHGRAVDFTIVGAVEYEDDPEAWEVLGELGEDLGLRWGGSFGDYGHFELPRR